MLSSLDDSYRLLGLSPGVGPAEVRRAFRREAKLRHPDLTGRADRADEFILLKRAYSLVLGHEEGLGERLGRGREEARPTVRLLGLGREDLDIWLELGLSSSEAARGLRTLVHYTRLRPCPHCRVGCPTCRGLGWLMVQGKQGLSRRTCPTCRAVEPEKCLACGGAGQISEPAQAHLLVPAGVTAESRLVLPGLGHFSSQRAGDLVLFIRIEPDRPGLSSR